MTCGGVAGSDAEWGVVGVGFIYDWPVYRKMVDPARMRHAAECLGWAFFDRSRICLAIDRSTAEPKAAQQWHNYRTSTHDVLAKRWAGLRRAQSSRAGFARWSYVAPRSGPSRGAMNPATRSISGC